MTTTPTPAPLLEDDLRPIRDALALGPRTWDYDSNQTPFYNDAEGHSRGGDGDGTYCLFGPPFFIDGESYDGPVLSERCSKADAYYITACNPQRIARLLAHIAELERDAFKYRWLRDGQESDWAICEWANDHDGRGFYRDARNADIVDAAIDAAIASEAKG